MRIDRGAFLSLTFGMAGTACNTGLSPVVANVVEIPRQPPQPSDAGTAIAFTPKDKSALPRAAVPSDSDDDSDDLGSNASEDGGGQANEDGCGFVDPKTVKRPAAACNDDEGTAPSCSVMKTCSGFAFPRSHCESYRTSFKAKVAAKALDCLAKLSAKQTCDDACTTYRCGDLALKSACPDPSADVQCMLVTRKCPAVSLTECRTYLSGLNATGRAKIVSCITSKSGCGFGLFSCSESL